MIKISDSFTFIRNKIPKNSKIFLYVRLKNLLNDDYNYKKQSEYLLDMVRRFLRPCEIYIPTYTYGFTDTLNFDINTTPSEVGRFSEEIRNIFAKKNYRTLDPIFSVIETEKGFFKNKSFNDCAFGKASIWEYLNKNNHYIVNINLDLPIVATQLHYLEYENNVKYRYMKYFEGTVIDWSQNKKKIKYGYFVRDLKKKPIWNREKIFKICKENGLVLEHGKIKIFEWSRLSNFLKTKLLKNSNYLIM